MALYGGENVKNVRVLGPRQKIIPPLACLMARLLRYIHPHVSRYALVDVPCRQTIIRRNRVELFLSVTLSQYGITSFPVPSLSARRISG